MPPNPTGATGAAPAAAAAPLLPPSAHPAGRQLKQEAEQPVVGVVAPVVGSVPLEGGPAPGPEVRCAGACLHQLPSRASASRRLAAALCCPAPEPARLLHLATHLLQSALLLTGPPILVAGTITVPAAEPAGRETTTTGRGLKQVRVVPAADGGCPAM